MEAGKIQAVDIRLPAEANTLKLASDGSRVPFEFLHVLVDSHREVPEVYEENNGAVLKRVDILPVDPALFAAKVESTGSDGTVLVLAGEGLGPEPGRVLLSFNGLELEPEILGWYDLGVRIRIPSLPLSAAASADIVVIRGDGAASNPLPIQLGG